MTQQLQILMRAPSPYLSSDLIYIEAVTHLHVGVGRSGGVVDLPVQRDENGFPCIYSSSLKGALKTAFLWAFLRKSNDLKLSRRAVEALLGPEPEPEESFESSVAILDASLVAMPVRSLKGVYAYITAPILLKRMLNYARLLEAASKSELVKDVEDLSKEAASIRSGECLSVGDHTQLLAWGNKIILLEELWLDPKQVQNGRKLTDSLGLDKPLLVLDDDTARYAVERGLIRIARVRLNRGTKTVEEGPWTEEYVPLKTRFVTAFLYKKPPLPEGFVRSLLSGREGSGGSAQEQRPINDGEYLEALVKLGLMDDSARDDVKKLLSQGDLYRSTSRITEAVKLTIGNLLKQLRCYAVLGGHETIGKGIIRLQVVNL